MLALAAAASWGASDFVGGLIGRRVPAVSVAFASQAVGFTVLVFVAPMAGGSATAVDMAWGAAAGLGGATGILLLYRGLALGQMSVVAPVTAVGAAAIPAVFGMVTGERPSVVALTGMVLALLAMAVLCSFGDEAGAGTAANPERRRVAAGMASAVVAGGGFGAFFICLGHTGNDAAMWPLLGARCVSVAALGALVLATRQPMVPGQGTGGAVVLTGALDVGANAAFLLASRRGLLSIVALLASLYPAVTVVLARFVLGERLSRPQTVGLIGAGGAVALIAIS